MILFHFLALLKFFLAAFVQICMVSQHVLKSILCIILVLVLYILYKYPWQRFTKVSALRKYKQDLLFKYKMIFFYEHLFNFFLLLVVALSLVLLMFLLRLQNKEKILNITSECKHIISLLKALPILDISLNFVLFLLLFTLYIVLLYKLTRYIKFHAIKRHLWFLAHTTYKQWYEGVFFYRFLYRINVYHLPGNILVNFRIWYDDHYYQKYVGCKNLPSNYEQLSYKEREVFDVQWPLNSYYFEEKYKLRFIIKTALLWGHYFVLLSLLFYDSIFNNMVISLVFYVLPWTFLYDFFVRLNKFIDDLHLDYDIIFTQIVYANSIEMWDKNTLIIDGDFYDLKDIRRIYKKYVSKNFVKDPNDVYA